jgi:hypothetical protein
MLKSVKASWLVFILLGGGMYMLRYHDVLPPNTLRMLIRYGPYALLVLHVTLVLMAFQDAMFQGILCLLVPLYSFYWLFMVTDLFMMRAVTAGILVGVGMDSVAFYQDLLNDTYRVVSKWIRSGGGDVW